MGLTGQTAVRNEMFCLARKQVLSSKVGSMYVSYRHMDITDYDLKMM